MYTFKRVEITNISKLTKVASILNACGKDMAQKYDLHHWDNTFFKSLVIVLMCSLKNDVYLIYNNEKTVATFMTKIQKESLHFEKLGTLPSESGCGIGSLCMNFIEEIAIKAGCKKVVMEVYEPSQHAISFYEHRGYNVTGMTETLKYKEIRMEKRL